MKDIKIINNKSMKTSYSLKSGLFFAYAFILNLENPLVRSIKDFCKGFLHYSAIQYYMFLAPIAKRLIRR
ncbi:hypothetical protein ACA29_15535 [Lederbergia galactosidilytica]|uniref:Uncharacterized protein n=1 Tax=Lederbergia galactosidilytica TaxID=217031 RepID=A0A0Q9Y4D8_9BACI|nr:hypothetical protein ACA29_15535 [Lederbergia galactosidilytica]